MFRVSIVGLFCFLFLGFPSAADDWEDALAAYDDGRFKDAQTLLMPLADKGEPGAQLLLSNLYNFGLGVPTDHAVALQWLTKAAAQDELEALYNLGTMTLQGMGTEPDLEEGLRLLQRAAELNSSDALFALGTMELQNMVITGEIDPALDYLVRSGQLGNRRASAMLATLLQGLPEVEHNLVKSALHYQVAIARGCDDLDFYAKKAIERLSPQERVSYDYNLAATLAAGEKDARDQSKVRGHCLSQ